LKAFNLLVIAVLIGGAVRASSTPSGWYLARGFPGVSLGNAQPPATFFDPSGVAHRSLALGQTVGPVGIELLSLIMGGDATDGGSRLRQQDLLKPISYRTVAIPLSQALSDLSKAAGTKLMADGDLGEERIILRLEAVPAKVMMDKIADVCSAEWKPVDGGFELFRSPAMVAKLEKANLDRRVSHITQSIQKMVSDANSDGRMTKDQAAMMADYFIKSRDLLYTGTRPPYNRQANLAMNRRMAETRLLAQVLAGMNPTDLANLAPGGRYVYTPKPNAVQRELQPIDEETMREYVEDQNMISDAVVDRITKAKRQISADVSDSYPHIKDLNLKPYLVIQPWTGTDTVQADLYINSSTQNVGFTSTLLANTMSSAEFWSRYDADQGRANSKGIELDPRLKPLLERPISNGLADAPPAPDPDIRSALLTPTEHDPLAFFTSECVLKIADADGVNVAFAPCDDCENEARLACRNGKFTSSLVQTLLAQYGGEECSNQDGWFTGKPLSPLRADARRCPRPEMQKYLRAIDEKGYASIEDQVALVMACAYATSDLLPSIATAELWSQRSNVGSYPSENAIRLYGSLSEEQKGQAKSNLELTYAQLTAEQREFLEWFVYTGFTNFRLTPQTQKSAVPGTFQLEKTDYTPNGLLAGDTLTVTDTNDDAVFYSLRYNDQPSFQRSGTIDEAAQQVAMAEKSPSGMKATVDNMRATSRRQITIKVTLQGKYEMSDVIQENHGGDAKGVGPDKFADTMSPAARDKYVAALARYRAQLQNTTFLNPDDQPQTPPPPR
jgi:hypothetical protein